MNNAANWPSTHLTLLARLRSLGNAEDWDEFWRIYSPLIYRFCQRRYLQHDDALDVSQNAMVALRKSLANFDPAKGKFRGWFGQLIRREIAKYKDKQDRDVQAIGGGVVPEIVQEAEDDDWDLEFNRHVVHTALSRIRVEFEPSEWEVMEQVVLAGRKPRDVAPEIGQDAAWISRAKYRLVQRLKSEVFFLANGSLE
ncbi:MAG: sigma-70 family RNA polymerase sigma factor [Planctomycetota bacterium]